MNTEIIKHQRSRNWRFIWLIGGGFIFGILFAARNDVHSIWLRAAFAGIGFAAIGFAQSKWSQKKPNQALEPTSTAVTPPAAAGDRASGTRGSP